MRIRVLTRVTSQPHNIVAPSPHFGLPWPAMNSRPKNSLPVQDSLTSKQPNAIVQTPNGRFRRQYKITRLLYGPVLVHSNEEQTTNPLELNFSWTLRQNVILLSAVPRGLLAPARPQPTSSVCPLDRLSPTPLSFSNESRMDMGLRLHG